MIRSDHVKLNIQEFVNKECLRLTAEQKQLFNKSLNSSELVASLLGSADCAQLLQFVARLTKAKRCLEIGTLTGYTSLSLALAVPEDGEVITIDITDDFLANGRELWKKAGVDHKIKSIIGNASDVIDQFLENNGECEKFDLTLIDGDHKNVKMYFEKCFKLVRPGGVVVVDSVLRDGKTANDLNQEDDVNAMREWVKLVREDDRVEFTMLTIGDGMALCMKK